MVNLEKRLYLDAEVAYMLDNGIAEPSMCQLGISLSLGAQVG